MKLTESKLRGIIREELQRLTEMGPENLHNADLGGMHVHDFGEEVADQLERKTGRQASYEPDNRELRTGGGIDMTNDTVILFEGATQNLYISLHDARGGIGGSIRTAEGRILRSFDAAPSGGMTPEAVVVRIVGALRDVGEI